MGLMIGETSEWGKGYGSETVRVLADFVHQHYKVCRVWLTVDSVHVRAIRAYKKAGFTVVREMDAPERIYSDGKQLLMEIRY